MLHVLEHAALDTLKIAAFIFVINIILSFFEDKIGHLLNKHKLISPLLGAAFGLVPQCGVPIVTAELYMKRHVTMGTLLAVFIACSDESVPILIGSLDPKAIYIIPLLIIKFVVGFLVGFIVDLILTKRKKECEEHLETCTAEEQISYGCCHHEINNDNENKWKKHLLHPFIHTLKISLYIFIITFAFGTLVHYVGQDKITAFFISNKYFAPLIAVLIGLIPNCVSSVLLTTLFLEGSISFGASLAGLIVNAGLGLFVLLKNKNNIKNTLMILLILVGTSIATGYLTCLILGF